MAIAQADLLGASQRAPLRKGFVTARAGQPTAFLCHSHHDRKLAEGLQTLLHEAGWDVYIDWQDADMPDKPDRETAQRIQGRIVSAGWFLFLATANATASRWCPWEIGYADGKKSIDRIVVIPTIDSSGKHHGNEYLQLYPQITSADVGGLAFFPTGRVQGGTFVKSLR
jgi:TIR domain